MQPRKNYSYDFGWSDMRTTTHINAPTNPTHTRTVFFELDNDGTPYTSRFSQAIIHNDHIHRASDNATNY